MKNYGRYIIGKCTCDHLDLLNIFKIDEKIKCILNVAKGLETGTNLRLSEVIKQSLPGKLKNKTCSLSGPNIAVEVGRNLPSVSVIASSRCEVMDFLQSWLMDHISTMDKKLGGYCEANGIERSGAHNNGPHADPGG